MPSLSAEESKALVKNGKESTKSSSPKTVGKSSLMWNLMAFVMIALTLLFACDVLEFKHDNKGITGNENAGVVSAPFTGGIVVLKTPNTNGKNQNDGASEPVQGDEETNSNPAQATAPPTLLPMPPPTEAPKTSQPTNKPIDAAKPNENENNNNNGDNNNKNSENGSAENDNVAKENDVPPMDVKNDSDNQNKKENNDNDSNSKQIAVTTTPSMGAGTPSRHTYNRRGQPMSDEDRKAMIEKWGSWTLVDDKKDQRPKEDFYAAYPNRDVPRKDFPQNAWQVDEAYLSKFVPEGLKMVTRAYNAILEEYGLDESDLKFFHVEKFDEFPDNVGSHECLHLGGCTTKKSWENLKRRLLHAIMTEDVFVFAMGGHSSAAGVRMYTDDRDEEMRLRS
jgi:outer membrane biosynthesis protein TonB